LTMIFCALVLKLECFSNAHSRAFVTVSLHKLGKVLLHLPQQCKTLVFAFQFLQFWFGFPIEQVSNVLTAVLTKFVWAVFAKVCTNRFQY